MAAKKMCAIKYKWQFEMRDREVVANALVMPGTPKRVFSNLI